MRESADQLTSMHVQLRGTMEHQVQETSLKVTKRTAQVKSSP